MPLDASRFAYSLAGQLFEGGWNLNQLQSRVRAAFQDHALHPPKVAERVFTAFPEKPTYDRLAAFLLRDARLIAAVGRSISFESLIAERLLKIRSAPRRPVDPRPARLQNIGLPSLKNESELAGWLGIAPPNLWWYADISGRNRRHPEGRLRLYRHRWIARRGRFPRLLEIPKYALKQLQRKVLDEILSRIPAHPAVHGFCAGRSILTNAMPHCGKRIVLRFDLTDFFPSVESARVSRIFRTIGYPQNVSRLLTGLCTTQLPADVWDARPDARDGADFGVRQRLITRHLPQGAPTSPMLANLAAHRLDRRLTGLAAKGGALYTRYADDLTFSGGDDLAQSRKRFAAHVAVIAREEGFSLNFRKTRSLRAGVRQTVTGVVVNVLPNIARSDFDLLKAILTNCVRHGPASQNRENVPHFRSHLSGRISHVSSVHRARGAKLKALFDRIEWPA